MPALSGLPRFHPGAAPLVVVSPHPDDESLAVGGLIAAQCACGRSVRLIAVTDGENAYPEDAGLAARRTAEQTCAAERLGIGAEDITRLHLPDGQVSDHELFLTEQLLAYVSKETHLLAPWPHDFHPDHEACGRAARAVAQQTGCGLAFYFFWTWHRGAPGLLHGLELRRYDLAKPYCSAKTEALAMHTSQLEHPSGDPVLHRIHLWPAMLPFEVYLPA